MGDGEVREKKIKAFKKFKVHLISWGYSLECQT